MITNDDRIYDQLWRLGSLLTPPEPLPRMPPDSFRRMLAMARIQGVLGIILEKLRSQPPACPEAWKDAQRVWQMEIVRSMRVRHHGRQVMASLWKAGIPAVIFKGRDFADNLYPQPNLRPTLDVDVLVPRDRWLDAARLLEATGHVEKRQQPPMFLDSGVVSERTWLYPSNSNVEVDLHWSLVHFPFFRRHAAVEYWNLDWNWAPAPSGQVAQGSLSPGSRLIVAAVHAVYHHQFDRLLLLTDIQGACRQIKDGVDEQRVRGLMERTGTSLALDVALQVTARFLNDPLIEQLRHTLFAGPALKRMIPEPLFVDARQNLRSIKTDFNTPGRYRIREWLAKQPGRPEPGWEFKPATTPSSPKADTSLPHVTLSFAPKQ
jgi:hypothetical protein